MALPIMATPVLEGEEALCFYKELEENEGKPVSDGEFNRCQDIYNAVKKKNPWLGGFAGNA
jgi:hypothetical protein